jgi:hypothetical protein
MGSWEPSFAGLQTERPGLAAELKVLHAELEEVLAPGFEIFLVLRPELPNLKRQ